MAKKQTFVLYVKNFIFGVEDSIVSTVGMLSGIAVVGVSRQNIFLAGLVLIFVEAFSMGIGSFLSEHASEKHVTRRNSFSRRTVTAALIMFASYFITGFVPLAPYVLTTVELAFPISIALSLLALFVLGLISGKVLNINRIRSGIEMVVIGGVTIGIGVIVGTLANSVILA